MEYGISGFARSWKLLITDYYSFAETNSLYQKANN